MKYTTLSDDDMDNVQKFAFGGIANPAQRAFLRASDREYLAERQAELDAFEEQRQSYNTGLAKYQEEVYNPYQQQSQAYNAAAQQYNTDVYNPYQQQYGAYEKAVADFNAGDRTSDYAGPAEPTLARQFDMQAPTAPGSFDMAAPVLPFKEEEIVARQQQAAETARRDAGNRATALNVVSNPDQFNFGSMSIANRFMAEGGEVKRKSAKEMLMEMAEGGEVGIDKNEQARREQTAREQARFLESGLSAEKYAKQEEEREESVRLGIAAREQAAAWASGKSAKEMLAQLREAQLASFLSRTKGGVTVPLSESEAHKDSAKRAQYGRQARKEELARREQGKTNPVAPPVAPPPVAPPPEAPIFAQPGISPGTTAIGSPDMPLAGALNTLNAIGANPNLSPTMLGGQQNAGVMTDRLGNLIYSPGAPQAVPAASPMPDPIFARPVISAPGVIGSQAEMLPVSGGTASEDFSQLNAVPAASPMPVLNLASNVSSPIAGAPTPLGSAPSTAPREQGGMANGPAALGINAQGPVINTQGLAMPMFNNSGLGGAATNPQSYFSMFNPGPPGISLGATAIGSPDMPMYGAMNTMNAMGSSPNLSPTMLGGQQNAGFMTDRLGNRIYSPGAPLLYGFAKGGLADATATANAYTMEDEEDVPVDTDPVGSAKKMLAAIKPSKKSAPSPIAKSIKKSGGASASKEMDMAYQPLSSAKEQVPELRDSRSARAQMEAMAEAYKLRAQAATQQSKGFIRDTMNAPTLDRPNLGKNTLTAKRFNEGGEVELTQEEIDAASKPAFVTPKSGIGRKEGPISQALKSGEAYVNVAKGLTEMPYNLAGAPMDLAMLARQGLTGQAPAGQVGTSDYIKNKMTELGIRQAPPTDPTAKGFYTAGDLLSNLVNPASVPRKVGPAIEKGVKAGATEVGRQLDRAIMDSAGPLAGVVPDAARPMYAVRPTGSTMLTGPVGLNKNVSEVDQLLQSGVSNAKSAAGQNEGQQKLLEDFWGKKARNYFERQFGTPDDPIMEGIKAGTLKGTALSSDLKAGFPEHLIESMSLGKTRSKEGARSTPEFVGPGKAETRFFPKHPRAIEDFTQRYDTATGLRGNLITTNPAAADPDYNLITSEGRAMGRAASEAAADKMLNQGMRPELINPEVGVTTRSVKDPERIVSDNSTRSAKDLYEAFEESSAYNKLTPEQQLEWANTQYGSGRSALRGMQPPEIGPNLLGENVRTAIEKGEPVYDINYMGKTLQSLFKPDNINEYLAGLPPRELANIRFEDAVRGGLKIGEKQFKMQGYVDRIKSGKPVADNVFSEGVGKPLIQFGEGSGLDGFAWKRIEKREATIPEGAYVGHSVGGYETGGVGYTTDKRNGFNTGKWQVYTLRDNRNRPVNTIEAKMLDEDTLVVTQIKGNGRATGNTAPEKYDGAVLKFLQDYLKPVAIEESDSLLTPLLQNYKIELGASPRAR